jgi:hypothetical protein
MYFCKYIDVNFSRYRLNVPNTIPRIEHVNGINGMWVIDLKKKVKSR